MKELIIAENAFEPDTWKHIQTEDVCASLVEHFGEVFPEKARIYWNDVAVANDVTPRTPADIERLQTLDGRFIVIVYPQWVYAIVAIIVIIVSVVASLALAPKVPNPSIKNTNQGSANNQLSGRTNNERMGERIPDIYGQVWSTPDLLAVPYSVYINNQQVEIAYMCIGRGKFSISTSDIYDGDTRVSDIAGSSVEVWAPNTSPNTVGGSPQYHVGSRISGSGFALQSAARSNSVNGQVLRPPNDETMTGSSNISFVYPDSIVTNDTGVDFTQHFDTDDQLKVTGASSVNSLNLNGTYDVLAVSNAAITLANPASVNSHWNSINSLPDNQTDYVSPTLATSGDKWIGPFTLNVDTLSQIICNFVATNGLYKQDNDGNKYAVNVTVEIEVTPVNPSIQPPRTVTYNYPGGNFNGWQFSGYTNGTGESRRHWSLDGSGHWTWEFAQNGFDPLWSDPTQVSFGLANCSQFELIATLHSNDGGSVNGSDILIYLCGAPTSGGTVNESNHTAVDGMKGPYIRVSPRNNNFGIYATDGTNLDNQTGVSLGYNHDYKVDILCSNNGDTTYNVVAKIYDGVTLLATSSATITYFNQYLGFVPMYAGDGGSADPTNGGKVTNVQVIVQFASGSAESFLATVYGSASNRTYRAATLYATPSFSGACTVRARRVSATDEGFGGTVVDSVQWQDFYAMSPVTQTDFGDVTTVLSQTYATAGALSVKERRLNMQVERILPIHTSGNSFSGTAATKAAADAFVQIALDNSIGNLSNADLDIQGIYDTFAAANTYFGISAATEFCYTFDKFNISLEEMLQTVANAAFCEAYRQGRVIGVTFEQKTTTSRILFNHRNKLPLTESRTITFGNLNNYDGVQFQWIDPTDDSTQTIYLPDNSSVNPQIVQSVGIRNEQQAQLLANRIWNKIKYQTTAIEFDSTHEAAMLNVSDRILVSDGTRPNVQEGDITAVNGLILTTSQPVAFVGGHSYTVFLQHYDESVEGITATAGTDDHKIVLSGAPMLPLVTDTAMYARTTYLLVEDNDVSQKAFLMTAKKPKTTYTYSITAVNYDDRYYDYDLTYHP